MADGDARCPKFSSGDWNEWLEMFDAFASLKDWTDEKKLKALPFYLEEPARDAFKSLTAAQRSDWNAVTVHLRQIFATEEDDAEKRFFERRQRAGETLSMFAASLRFLARKAFADHSVSTLEKMLLRQFLRGIDKQVAEDIVRQNPKTLSAAVADSEVALQIRRTYSSGSDSAPLVEGMLSVCTSVDETRSELDSLKQMVQSLAVTVSELVSATKRADTKQKDYERRPQQGNVRWRSPTPSEAFCRNSREFSPARNDRRRNRSVTPARQGRDGQRRCYACGQWGHIRRECPGYQGGN